MHGRPPAQRDASRPPPPLALHRVPRRCFGFETAVEEAQRALLAANVEARSASNGLGLVKLMGRQSGFIAMQASMASGARGPRSAWRRVAAAAQHTARGRAVGPWAVATEVPGRERRVPGRSSRARARGRPGARDSEVTGGGGAGGVPFGALCAWAAGVVDVCLIPEVPFKLPEMMAHLEHVFATKGHAVVCVAEGAGQVRRSCAVAR